MGGGMEPFFQCCSVVSASSSKVPPILESKKSKLQERQHTGSKEKPPEPFPRVAIGIAADDVPAVKEPRARASSGGSLEGEISTTASSSSQSKATYELQPSGAPGATSLAPSPSSGTQLQPRANSKTGDGAPLDAPTPSSPSDSAPAMRKKSKKSHKLREQTNDQSPTNEVYEGADPSARKPTDRRASVENILGNLDARERAKLAAGGTPTGGSRRSSIVGALVGRRNQDSADMMPAMQARGRRNSQATYAEESQTIIVLDWDDTLFPTSYLLDELRLSTSTPLKDQNIPGDMKKRVVETLKVLMGAVDELLRLAHSRGRVVLVTLARAPWVTLSCDLYYPEIGQLLKELDLKIVYAQEGVQVDYDKKKMSDDQVQDYYTSMKANAIYREVEAFYSQYEGQSWKNIISIGDGEFERLGTHKISMEYMVKQGIISKDAAAKRVEGEGAVECVSANVDGHLLRLRTKTFKMLDGPTIDELTAQLRLHVKWLPYLIALDGAFDVDLNTLDDAEVMATIEAKLGIQRAPSKTSSRVPSKSRSLSKLLPWRKSSH
eukprot:TRINITY_DN21727_c0_g1_i1.p1 TRINITY_DN21727_c0_g1~~TRINITY_DN21727_c0_g1_i1.p1  ORF type:complete len:550 (-),score=112.54 TRINITY_DN21727_c0_g1_i1:99-1748(-)